jgi:hypothetical protein
MSNQPSEQDIADKEAAMNAEEALRKVAAATPVRQNSLAALMSAKANELKTNPNAPPLSAAETTLDPLALSSLQKAALDTSGYNPDPFRPTILRRHVEAPPGSYLALRLPYLILKTGAKVQPTDGYFIPRSQEEYDMLEHFAKQENGLVEVVQE